MFTIEMKRQSEPGRGWGKITFAGQKYFANPVAANRAFRKVCQWSQTPGPPTWDFRLLRSGKIINEVIISKPELRGNSSTTSSN